MATNILLNPEVPEDADLDANRALISQEHPRYIEWKETWKLLGHIYEGDGPFLDGDGLVAHPREIVYATDPVTGEVDTSEIKGFTAKFYRRQKIARYENFAQTIVDTFVAYLFAKPISRVVGEESADKKRHPLEDWWDDVDGEGTSMSDWMQARQILANVFGHVWIIMDRERVTGPAVSRAAQGRPILRSYVPLDVPDWLCPGNKPVAVKVVEAVERKSLFSSTLASKDQGDSATDRSGLQVQYRIWDREQWALYDQDGGAVTSGPHGFPECPVVVLYSNRRARIPLIGRSLLGDGKLFQDHYNLLSELRELLRGQTFSMLHIGLAEEEQVDEARQRLGNHAGVDNVIYTKGGAGYVAPPDGPAGVYAQTISDLERKMYRLVGLPWEGDSGVGETADSRRLKAMDLNRFLAKQASECEVAEYAIARLWFLATYGEAGEARFDSSEVSISYPDEFHTEAILDVVNNARATISLGLGRTADKETKKRALPVLLPDLDIETKKTIEAEIEAAVDVEADSAEKMQQAMEAQYVNPENQAPSQTGDLMPPDTGFEGEIKPGQFPPKKKTAEVQ